MSGPENTALIEEARAWAKVAARVGRNIVRDVDSGILLARRLADALEAAGVAPQPEPEYEYSWEGVDDEGDDWIMGEWFATVAGAERYADSRMGNWVRTDNGKLIRRVKAGAWEPAPNQPDGDS